MLFFDLRKIKKRKVLKQSVHKRPDSQRGKDWRNDKDSWLYTYYQLDPKQRLQISRIIKVLEEEIDGG